MGRNKTRPSGYNPLLQFYLRRKLEGGKLLIPADIRGSAEEKTRRECLILVHGFNNTDSEAAAAYFGFRAAEQEIFQPADGAAFDRRFGDAFWPGDADGWSFLDKVDFLVYPSAVHTAVHAGAELASAVWRMPNLEQLDFIGHSLGCRVVLETLLALRQRAVPLVRRVVLMAAAVPSEMLEPGGRFYDLLTRLASEGTRIDVLHSQQDTVLHYAFPTGQSLAGGGEGSARALGRYGPSPLMPGFRGTMLEREISGAAHGDYWGSNSNSASTAAAAEAGGFLSLGQLGRDIGLKRELGTPALDGESRELGSPRERSEIG